MSVFKGIFNRSNKSVGTTEVEPETTTQNTTQEILGKNSTHEEEQIINATNSVMGKATNFANDPLTTDATRLGKKIFARYAGIITGVLDNSAVLLGICTGLFGMSVVAVIFHFIRSVVNLDTSDILQSVSYGVFFTCLIVGIIKTRGEGRIITRLNTKHLEAQDRSMRQQQKMKSYYEDLLKDKMTEKEKSDIGFKNYQKKVDEQINEQRRQIKTLETKVKKKKFYFKRFKLKQKNN